MVGIQGLSVWAMKSNRGQSRASRVRGGHQVDRLMEDEGQEDTPARPQQQHRRQQQLILLLLKLWHGQRPSRSARAARIKSNVPLKVWRTFRFDIDSDSWFLLEICDALISHMASKVSGFIEFE